MFSEIMIETDGISLKKIGTFYVIKKNYHQKWYFFYLYNTTCGAMPSENLP